MYYPFYQQNIPGQGFYDPKMPGPNVGQGLREMFQNMLQMEMYKREQQKEQQAQQVKQQQWEKEYQLDQERTAAYKQSLQPKPVKDEPIPSYLPQSIEERFIKDFGQDWRPRMNYTQYVNERKRIEESLKDERELAQEIAKEDRKKTTEKSDDPVKLAEADAKLIKDMRDRIDSELGARKDVYDSNTDLDITRPPFENQPEVKALGDLKAKLAELDAYLISTQTPLSPDQRKKLASIATQIDRPQVQKNPKLRDQLLGKAWDVINNILLENSELIEFLSKHPTNDPAELQKIKDQWILYKKQKR